MNAALRERICWDARVHGGTHAYTTIRTLIQRYDRNQDHANANAVLRKRIPRNARINIGTQAYITVYTRTRRCARLHTCM